MEPSLPLSVDSGIKEESDLTASASSSSLRLSSLTSSSSSRRLGRHVSPPPSSRPGSQKKGLGTGQSQLTPHKPTYSETFATTSTPSSSVGPNDHDEMHRTPVQATVAVTQAYKVIRGIVFLWKWFCFGYFCVAIFDKLKCLTVDWRYSELIELPAFLPTDPESILSTLPVEHRLSKLSSLYPIPLSLKPFILGPREQGDYLSACLWTDESGLSLVQEWAASWSGPISLLVTYSAPPSSMAYKELLSRLGSLSQAVPNISFHLQHTSSSLRNFNAYINIARLFSPGSKVLLFPPSALTLWGPSPQTSTVVINTVRQAHEQFIIPLLPLGLSNASSLDMSRDAFLSTAALLLDQENAPWCTERLFTIVNETTAEGNYQLASTLEMALHWRECIWNSWLRSHGEIQLLYDEGWSASGGPSSTLHFDAMPETVESNLRVRLARKQRSETCFLVAREMVALGEWFAVGASQAAGTVGEATGDGSDGEAKHVQIESTTAKWLRSVCRESLEHWGKELIMD